MRLRRHVTMGVAMRISVLSDGGWGTALALLLVRNGHAVSLWGHFPDYVAEMRRSRENVRFLPGPHFPDDLALSDDLAQAVDRAELIVLASPAQYMRALVTRVQGLPRSDEVLFVSVAKGIEVGTLRRMSQVVDEVLGPVPFVALSGPSHAEEVAREIPTAVVTASRDLDVAGRVQAAFMSETFRVYTSTDVTGVELGGSLKNVLALAAGVCDGMGLGDNTKAALMTRGNAEMARLGKALGGRPETFAGLSGIGDLIVTCTSRHSRNRYVGEQLGRGRTLAEIQEEMGMAVAEGVKTAHSAHALARRAEARTPIVDEVYESLYEGKDPRQVVHDLMTREAKPELPGEDGR